MPDVLVVAALELGDPVPRLVQVVTRDRPFRTGSFPAGIRRRPLMLKVATRNVRVGRVYDPPEQAKGTRVLVDRLWPRGLSKASAALDRWCREVAPSDELRRWYAHDPARFKEFRRRYRAELKEPARAEAMRDLKTLARKGDLILLTATKQSDISQAAVLAELLT